MTCDECGRELKTDHEKKLGVCLKCMEGWERPQANWALRIVVLIAAACVGFALWLLLK